MNPLVIILIVGAFFIGVIVGALIMLFVGYETNRRAERDEWEKPY